MNLIHSFSNDLKGKQYTATRNTIKIARTDLLESFSEVSEATT